MEDLCEWFSDRNMMDVVEEFNKLCQEGSVQSYQLKFEKLKSLMLILNPHLMKMYFVSSFVSGLSKELKAFCQNVIAQTHQTSSQVCTVARVASGGVDEKVKMTYETHEFEDSPARRKECREKMRKEQSGGQGSKPIHYNCSIAYKQQKVG